jgi:hypothetical protein
MCGKRRVSKRGLGIISDARAEVKGQKAKVAINAEQFTGTEVKKRIQRDQVQAELDEGEPGW